MKNYLFIIFLSAIILNTSCDSRTNEEALFADVDQAVELSDPHARMGSSSGGIGSGKANFNYGIAENAYQGVMTTLPPSKVEEMVRSSRSREFFLTSMIRKSMTIFDSTLIKRGATFSDAAKRNHSATAGDEHEIEYDIAKGPMAAISGYLKLDDIKGESQEKEYPFAKIFSGNGATSTPSRSPWEDSIPPIKKPELEETAEFVLGLNARSIDPESLNQAMTELEIGYGVDPVAIGLLLPAVQSAREAARNSNARGKADILIESLGFYGLDLEDDLSNMYKIGGMGSIGMLASEKYDASGDVDWATIQLNRKKFEVEMFFLWSRFWENSQPSPTSGR